MLFSEIIQAAQYKIVEGSDYQWQCYGKNARMLDFTSDGGDSGVNCIFDSVDQTIYEVCVYPKKGECYRWVNPEYLSALKKEYKKRELDFNMATESEKWIVLENKEDVLRKTSQVINTGQCDDDITIIVDLPKEELYQLCLKAHKENMTLNDYLIKTALDEISEDKQKTGKVRKSQKPKK